jgi:hypothetical protein
MAAENAAKAARKRAVRVRADDEVKLVAADRLDQSWRSPGSVGRNRSESVPGMAKVYHDPPARQLAIARTAL